MRRPRLRTPLSSALGALLLLVAATGRAVAPPGSRAFVSDETADSVTVLGLNPFGSSFGSISVGDKPMGSALSPSGNRLYVANGNTNTVSVIDTSSDLLTNTITLSIGNPYGIVATPDGTKVYVSVGGSGAVLVISATTLTQTGTIALPEISSSAAGARGLALSPSGAKLYVVANFQDVVHVIDTVTDQVVGSPIPVGFNPETAAFNGAGTRLIVVGFGAPTIIDTSNDSVVATSLTDNGTQKEVAVAGNRAVVTNNFNAITDDPSLDVYDLGTATLTGSIPLFGSISGVAISPDGTRAWVSGNGVLPPPPTAVALPGSAATPETAPGSATDAYLVEVDPVNLGTTGNSATLVSLPGHVTGLFPAAAGQVVGYFLPKNVNLSIKGGGKDSLLVAGFYDDGGAEVDYSDEVTVEAGDLSRSVTLVPNARGTSLKFKDGTLSMTLRPNLKGSSRGSFKMKVARSTLTLDPDEALEMHFHATGLPDAAGTVTLTGGKYTLGRVRGALIDPAFFPAKALVAANEDKPDTVSLKGGFSTGGTAPETLGTVTVSLGPVFTVAIPGGAFDRTGDVFKHKSSGDGRSLAVTLDYSRELLTVKAKGYEVGPLNGDTVDVALDPGDGGGSTSVTIRMSVVGTKRKY